MVSRRTHPWRFAAAFVALVIASSACAQSDTGARDGFAIQESGAWLVAENAPHRFVARFSHDSFMLGDRAATGALQRWEATVRVAAFGCRDELSPLPATRPFVDPAQRNRVEQIHEQVTAWYINGPLGLEQGFEVMAPPACLPSDGTLTLAMTVAGLTPQLGAGGDVELANTDGAIVLHYHGLHVTDADGAALPASLRAGAGSVSIDVDVGDARFPITIDPTWSQRAELIASDAVSDDQVGQSVSMSGDTAIVGAPGADNDVGWSSGSAYVFVRRGDAWSEQAKLTANDAGSGDWFGASVSVSGDIAIVGAPKPGMSGSAYVFVRSGDTWTQEAKLTGSDAGGFAQFGVSVSLWGDTALIGASGAGAAFVFVRNGTSWDEQAKLVPDVEPSSGFGRSVSLFENTALIGAGARAHVFERSGDTWLQEATLTASDGVQTDGFGWSVSVSGGTALVGAGHSDSAAEGSGAAYVFNRGPAGWTEEAKLAASDGAAWAMLGRSVSLSGDTALVGASAAVGSGAAYLFVRRDATWVELSKLTVGAPAPSVFFGASVYVADDRALVGAPNSNGNTGAAYVFQADIDEMRPSDDDDSNEGGHDPNGGHEPCAGAACDDDSGSQDGPTIIAQGFCGCEVVGRRDSRANGRWVFLVMMLVGAARARRRVT
jgi:FG-GAP repeat